MELLGFLDDYNDVLGHMRVADVFASPTTSISTTGTRSPRRRKQRIGARLTVCGELSRRGQGHNSKHTDNRSQATEYRPSKYTLDTRS